MEQYKEGQYDDDLTVGIDEYDENFDTGGVDLFDYLEDADSPLARLKSIILSIDWEINDDILRQFNEELHDLRNIWADNKINVIYVQALEKLSRYIYKEKSSSHPSAIKLLLTFYANLEKIVSDEELSDQEKKKLLREDVARFEHFKKQIVPAASPVSTPVSAAKEKPAPVSREDRPAEVTPAKDDQVAGASPAVEKGDSVSVEDDPLLNLKAIVYGIDWEITEQDLAELSREVKQLEKTFKSSKAKQIFLQGIGSLGAYIKLKKSDAHADAFKLLHSFFVGLETVVRQGLTGQAEKDILFPEVEKFNKFKAIIAGTISSEAIAKAAPADEDEEDFSDAEIQPAFADVPEDVHGFQEEQEAALLAKKESPESDVVDEYFEDDEDETPPEQVDPGIAGEMESRLEGMFEEPGKEVTQELDAEIALQGVDVESDADDDSDEEPLLVEDGEFAPALAIEDQPEEDSPAVFADKVDDFFDESEEPDISTKALPGVDVEHDADDDLEEELLPFVGGEYAPALTGSDEDEQLEKSAYEDESEIQDGLDDFFGKESEDEEDTETPAAGDDAESETDIPAEDTVAPEAADIEDRLTDFFGQPEPETVSDSGDEALKGVEVETVEDDESGEEPLPFHDGEIAPALTGEGEDEPEGVEEEVASLGEDDDQRFTPAEEEEDLLAGEDLMEDDDGDGFSELFGDDKETEDEPFEETDVLRGVDVETPEDDDSEEEALPFEDGELAPALASDDASAAVFSEDADNEAEADISDRFDSFFGTEEEETTEELDPTAFQVREEAEDKEPDPDLFQVTEGEEIEEDPDSAAFKPAEEPEEDDEFQTEFDDERLEFDEEAFQEIPEDEIEEFPAEAFGGKDKEKEDEEILALLGDDDAGTDPFREEAEDELASAFSDYPEDSIPEVSAEELEAVLDDEESVVAAGEIPSGYPSSDELLARFGEVAGEEDIITHPEGNEDFILAVEDPHAAESIEDEVVFEEVDEEELGEVISFDEEVEEKDYDKADSFGTTLLANQSFVEKKLPVADTSAKKIVDDEPVKDIEEEESAYVLRQDGIPASDVLQSLRNCIVSLGLEIDDAILDGLNEEITKLRHSWLDKPAERTFVQLLSTVTAHIERYRYDADAEANRLLLSIFDKLELCVMGQANSTEIQESVLNETSKVLQWQARLIDRTSAQKEERARLPREGDEAVTLDQDFVDAQAQAPVGTGLEEMSKKVEEIGNDIMMQKVSSIMRTELDQLKAAFHAELRELKEEIFKGRRKE